MLNMSVELSLDWDQPQSELITSYEIYTTSNNNFVCAYDHFGERAGTVVNGSLTKFSQTFSALVEAQNTPMLVLVIITHAALYVLYLFLSLYKLCAVLI